MSPPLFLLVSSGLSPGMRAAQAVHAAVAFQEDFPEQAEEWRRSSNTVVVLSSGDLLRDVDRLRANELEVSVWREPDLDDRVTAIAVCGPLAKSLLRKHSLSS